MSVTIVPATLPGERVTGILDAATAHDGVSPFSEQFLNGLHDSQLAHRHLLAEDEKSVVAVAALAPDGSVELVVDPSKRRKTIGAQLIAQVRSQSSDSTASPAFWAHGNLEAAQATARSFGMEATRELLKMSLERAQLEAMMAAKTNAAAAPGSLPAGYTLVNYPEAVARWGRDEVEQQWLRVNNDAFSWHPEQGGWDLDRLHRGMAADWFEPQGVWFLYTDVDEAAQLAGFHWTKRHGDGTGEVYVVGLGSPFRGQGLGGPLMHAGLAHLASVGSSQVILYVEADNEAAVKRYNETGFTIAETHVVYQFPGN